MIPQNKHSCLIAQCNVVYGNTPSKIEIVFGFVTEQMGVESFLTIIDTCS